MREKAKKRAHHSLVLANEWCLCLVRDCPSHGGLWKESAMGRERKEDKVLRGPLSCQFCCRLLSHTCLSSGLFTLYNLTKYISHVLNL